MDIPFSRYHFGQEEYDAVARVMQSGWIAAGPEVEAFEKEFSNYISPEGEQYYCIFTNCGTSALKMAYKYYLEQGVYGYHLLTPNTFSATYAAAHEIGMVEAYKLRGELVQEVTVATHYGGVKYGDMPGDLHDDLVDIEDSAHRIAPNDPLIGKIRIYSFYATKNMTTGSGGMFVTNDKEIYERARLYWKDGLTTSTLERSRGADNYVVSTMAGGYDGNDLAAAIGRVQLTRLPDFTARRNRIRDTYNAAFNQSWTGNHLYPYFCTSVEEIKAVRAHLKAHGIACSYHYPNPNGDYRPDWLGLSLPIYPDLSDNEVNYVIETILNFGKTYGASQNTNRKS